MSDNILRLFVAVEVPYPSMGAELVAHIRSMGIPIHPVQPDHSHVSLKFMGDTPAEAVGKITRTLDECLASFQPFELSYAGFGTFGSQRFPRVLWVGIEDGGILGRMAASIDAALARTGVPRDVRPFSPHLTLGRFGGRGGHPTGLSPSRIKGLKELLELTDAGRMERFTIDSVLLKRSILRPGGPVYSDVHRVDLEEAGIHKVPGDAH